MKDECIQVPFQGLRNLACLATPLSFAHQGLGLAYVADVEAAEDLATGRLESVLRSYIHPTVGMHLYFPAKTQAQPKVRAFIDTVRRRA